MDKQLKYLIIIYTIATILTFALDWQLPGFEQVAHLSKKIDLDRYLIPDYMTYWQCTHFLTRFLLGFFCPNYWHVIFVVDFGWETLEWYQWNAHNWYDLIWNMLGLITGIALRYYGILNKYFGFNKKDNVDTDVNDTDAVNADASDTTATKLDAVDVKNDVKNHHNDIKENGHNSVVKENGHNTVVSENGHNTVVSENVPYDHIYSNTNNNVNANSNANNILQQEQYTLSNDVYNNNMIPELHKNKKYKDKNIKKRKKEKEKHHNK